MKSLNIIIICLLTILMTSNAQNNRGYVGVNLNVGVEIAIPGGFEFQPGIKVKYGYEIVRRLYIEPNFNIFFGDPFTVWDFNLDVHYKFYPAPRFNIYPIAGFKVAHEKYNPFPSYTSSETAYGANFGVGFGYDITRRWFVNIDFRYSTVQLKNEEANMGLGFGYRF